jgi:hypothetical protein
MSPPRRARLAEPLLQLLAAAALLVLASFDQEWAVLGLVGLVAVWPPRVAWRPVAAAAVLRSYLLFAVPWFLAVVGYLRALHALGHPVPPQPMLSELATHGIAAPGAWLLVAGIVVVAPLAEEVLFRGYLFTGLRTVLSERATEVATAALFGLAHGPAYALPIAALALLFGRLRLRHGALLPSVLAHAVHNGITVLLALLWPGLFDLMYPR